MNVGDVFDGWTVKGFGSWANGASKFVVCEHACGATRKFQKCQVAKLKQPCKRCEARVAYRKKAKHIILGNMFNQYKHSAKKRGYSFELSKNEFSTLVLGNCKYCKRPPFQVKQITTVKRSVWHEGEILIACGIDRVDNTLGYVSGNCVSCCSTCNVAKQSLSIDEWREMVGLWSAALG